MGERTFTNVFSPYSHGYSTVYRNYIYLILLNLISSWPLNPNPEKRGMWKVFPLLLSPAAMYLLLNKLSREAATRGVLWKNDVLQSLWHKCFPVKFTKFLRTTFLLNTSGRLLLFHQHSVLYFTYMEKFNWIKFHISRFIIRLRKFPVHHYMKWLEVQDDYNYREKHVAPISKMEYWLILPWKSRTVDNMPL